MSAASQLCRSNSDSRERIKKAYRKKALELHPDRNYGNVEETTAQFAAVQSAYEILSDPQERAWYDTHRDEILRNDDDIHGEHYDHNVRVTTAGDIMSMFSHFHGSIDYSDSATGFYSTLRDTFARLAKEEALACEWEGLDPVDYPSFGHANDSYEVVVRPFYTLWNGFSTRKTFSWEDVYRYSDAPDRRIRRMMEKENKYFREEGIRAFNDAVRSLVAFVKKRDPRFKPNRQTEAERGKALRDASVAQAARSRAANQAKYAQKDATPGWMKPEEADNENFLDEESDAIEEHFECLVCKKNFKSEKQYEVHEKSKKHLKLTQHIRWEMQQENKKLGLDDIDTESTRPSADAPTGASNVSDDMSEEFRARGDIRSTEDRADDVSTERVVSSKGNSSDESKPQMPPIEVLDTTRAKSLSSSENDEYAPRKIVEDRVLGKGQDEDELAASQFDIADMTHKLTLESSHRDNISGARPVGKAKEKRARKAAQKPASAGSGSELKCAACQAGFPSKSRLFNHIKDFGHAQPIPKPTKSGKGKKT